LFDETEMSSAGATADSQWLKRMPVRLLMSEAIIPVEAEDGPMVTTFLRVILLERGKGGNYFTSGRCETGYHRSFYDSQRLPNESS